MSKIQKTFHQSEATEDDEPKDKRIISRLPFINAVYKTFDNSQEAMGLGFVETNFSNFFQMISDGGNHLA